jgi:streptomycin 6-kinase
VAHDSAHQLVIGTALAECGAALTSDWRERLDVSARKRFAFGALEGRAGEAHLIERFARPALERHHHLAVRTAALPWRLLCETAARLHARRGAPVPDLHPLETWFQPLLDFSDPPDWLRKSAATARQLLSAQPAIAPLHGDLHHDNVLDFGARGWKAIDPHGLLGERVFDYANIFTNPDLSDPQRPLATLPGRFEARLTIVTRRAGIAPADLLRWIVAWTGLSAAWFLDDGDEAGAAIDRRINATAFGLLGA